MKTKMVLNSILDILKLIIFNFDFSFINRQNTERQDLKYC